MKSNNLITKLLTWWSSISEGQHQDYDGILPLKTVIFDQFAEISGSIISIHSLETLRVDYITPNVTKILGLTQQQVIERGNDYFMSRVSEDHSHYLSMLFGLVQEVAQRELNFDLTKMHAYVCGIKYKTENNEIIKLLLDYNPLPPAFGMDKLTHTLAILSNVSHLYKREDFWIQLVYENALGQKKIMTYHPDFERILHENFISVREIEILEYICEGFETVDIAKQLGISPNTINNHRQKLLDKFGAKDTTALVQLAQKISYK
jgi:DNA-binding CsgD family transcriptional regulator